MYSLFFLRRIGFIPDIFEKESGIRRVSDSTEWQQHRVRHLQGTAGNGGTEAYLEAAAIFTFKINAVLILTLRRAVGKKHKHNT